VLPYNCTKPRINSDSVHHMIVWFLEYNLDTRQGSEQHFSKTVDDLTISIQ
jgi:hypothetical protein